MIYSPQKIQTFFNATVGHVLIWNVIHVLLYIVITCKKIDSRLEFVQPM